MKTNIINVLDIEATCYKRWRFPEGEKQEVIEFGLTTVDLNSLRILQTYCIPVVPVMSTVSPFCTELTGWTYERLKKQGIPFADACARIVKKYGGRNRLLATDSNWDINLVRRECTDLGVEYPFGASHLNISEMFCVLTKTVRNLNLRKKLRQLGLEFIGKQHRADNDSMNIARLLIETAKKGAITPA